MQHDFVANDPANLQRRGNKCIIIIIVSSTYPGFVISGPLTHGYSILCFYMFRIQKIKNNNNMDVLLKLT